MKCPKCSYISFDYNSVCPKCNKDISSEQKKMSLPAFRPDPPYLLSMLTGEADDSSVHHLDSEGFEAETPAAFEDGSDGDHSFDMDVDIESDSGSTGVDHIDLNDISESFLEDEDSASNQEHMEKVISLDDTVVGNAEEIGLEPMPDGAPVTPAPEAAPMDFEDIELSLDDLQADDIGEIQAEEESETGDSISIDDLAIEEEPKTDLDQELSLEDIALEEEPGADLDLKQDIEDVSPEESEIKEASDTGELILDGLPIDDTGEFQAAGETDDLLEIDDIEGLQEGKENEIIDSLAADDLSTEDEPLLDLDQELSIEDVSLEETGIKEALDTGELSLDDLQLDGTGELQIKEEGATDEPLSLEDIQFEETGDLEFDTTMEKLAATVEEETEDAAQDETDGLGLEEALAMDDLTIEDSAQEDSIQEDSAQEDSAQEDQPETPDIDNAPDVKPDIKESSDNGTDDLDDQIMLDLENLDLDLDLDMEEPPKNKEET
jgi:hypothetical protein